MTTKSLARVTPFVSVTKGKLVIDLGNVKGTFAHDKVEEARAFCDLHKIRSVQCSSSIDFADEDGWPEDDAHDFVDYAISWRAAPTGKTAHEDLEDAAIALLASTHAWTHASAPAAHRLHAALQRIVKEKNHRG